MPPERAPRRTTLTRRLAVRFTAAILAILAVLGFALDRVVERAFLDDLTSALTGQAEALRHALPTEPGRIQATVRSLGRDLEVRITVIRTDGSVAADSSRPTTRGIENHADRPEVRAALRGEVGVATRRSETVGRPFRYVALPAERGLIVRVALPLAVVEGRLARVRAVLAIGFLAAAVAGLAVVWLVARSITRPVGRMTEAVARLPTSGGRVPEDGTAELALLARTLNTMADDLQARLDQIGGDRRLRDAILAAMEEGVILTDGAAVAYANAAAHRLLGGVPATVPRILPVRLPRLIAEARKSRAPAADELDLGRALVRASAIPMAEDRVLVVLRDVTEARRVEAMRRDFVASASHELKTPAASIQAGAETLSRAIADDPEAARRFAGQLERDAVRLSRLVTDLLDLSRLEAEERDEPRAARLDRIAAEEAERLRPRAADAGVELDVTTEPAEVTGWPKDLGTLARNLLDNAIRSTPAGGRIDVAVRTEGGRAVLTVRDTGIGIPTRDLPRIFERFYRVDPARSRDTGGTGLGLAIAKHVAEEHGGTIEATSELGRGSSFTVSLPSAGQVPGSEPPQRSGQ